MLLLKPHVFLILSLFFIRIQAEEYEDDDYESNFNQTTEDDDEIVKNYVAKMARVNYTRTLLKTISVIFLIVLIVIYSKNKQSNSSDKYIIVHCYAYMIYIIFNCTENFLSFKNVRIFEQQCLIFATIWGYCFLASFFWLQIMCFDIWHSFRKSSDSPTNVARKFKMYCLYAFGMPLILIPAIIFLYIKINDLRSYLEVDNCTVDIGIFLIIPTMITVVINIYFLVSTSRRIRTTRNNMQNIENAEFLRYKLYLKLFGLLGSLWSLEFFLFICGPIIPANVYFHPVISLIVHIWVCIMDLQGFLIFIVCVWMTHYRNVFLKTCAPCGCAQRCAWRSSTHDLAVEYRTDDQI